MTEEITKPVTETVTPIKEPNEDCQNQTLRYENLWEKQLSDSNYNGSDFSDANATGANFENNWMVDCVFVGLMGERASFKGVGIGLSNFNKARLNNANMEGVYGDRTDFTLADLSWVNLKNSNFKNTTFADATLINCDAEGAVFENCSFVGADLSGMVLKQTKFIKCKFERALLYKLNFADCASIDGSIFYGADFGDLDLKKKDGPTAPASGIELERTTPLALLLYASNIELFVPISKEDSKKVVLGEKIVLSKKAEAVPAITKGGLSLLIENSREPVYAIHVRVNGKDDIEFIPRGSLDRVLLRSFLPLEIVVSSPKTAAN